MSVSTRIPKYRRHKTGQAFVQVKNRRIYLGKHGTQKSKEAYRRIIAERCGSTQASVIDLAANREGISINEMILAYMRHNRTQSEIGEEDPKLAQKDRPVIIRRSRAVLRYGLCRHPRLCDFAFGVMTMKDTEN